MRVAYVRRCDGDDCDHQYHDGDAHHGDDDDVVVYADVRSYQLRWEMIWATDCGAKNP